MMPATKESWIPLAEQLFAKGLNVLAIDFRGHGESGGGDYKSFANQEHQKYILDAESGLGFLREHYPDCEVVLAGASIGANIALQAMVNDNSLHQSVALSAGLDYYGVKAEDFVGKLSREQQVLFVGSLDDLRGGVRCEKMSAYLQSHGFTDVYQLDGGIHTYMERFPGKDFQGTLYTFDRRLTMDFGGEREVIGTCHLCGKTTEHYVDCAEDTCHYHFLACEQCTQADGRAFCSDACRATHV
jgi:pimeloyl-ACP methyl ester carboxylesterase